ncbi:MAG: hypothetical protein HYT93_02425 [Parcubacteria group bacterium]|nr:hypothetical protein [Parcubacteria group bacterium]
MTPDQIGILSGTLVVVSAIPYAYRTWQGKIKPSVTSWSLWTLIGFLLLVTYASSGAEDNIWPAVFGFTNPLLIAVLAAIKKGEWTKLTKAEQCCVSACVGSLLLWVAVKESRELAQFALYLAILADACAAIPTIIFIRKNPQDDRPFMWVLFGVGYSIAMFAVTENTFANYFLPAYMLALASFVSIPLFVYRIKNKIPLREWI